MYIYIYILPLLSSPALPHSTPNLSPSPLLLFARFLTQHPTSLPLLFCSMLASSPPIPRAGAAAVVSTPATARGARGPLPHRRHPAAPPPWRRRRAHPRRLCSISDHPCRLFSISGKHSLFLRSFARGRSGDPTPVNLEPGSSARG